LQLPPLRPEEHDAVIAVVSADTEVQHLDFAGAMTPGDDAIEALRIGFGDEIPSFRTCVDEPEGAGVTEGGDPVGPSPLAVHLRPTEAPRIELLPVDDKIRLHPEVHDGLTHAQRDEHSRRAPVP